MGIFYKHIDKLLGAEKNNVLRYTTMITHVFIGIQKLTTKGIYY
jgi:hypothetical protein